MHGMHCSVSKVHCFWTLTANLQSSFKSIGTSMSVKFGIGVFCGKEVMTVTWCRLRASSLVNVERIMLWLLAGIGNTPRIWALCVADNKANTSAARMHHCPAICGKDRLIMFIHSLITVIILARINEREILFSPSIVYVNCVEASILFI